MFDLIKEFADPLNYELSYSDYEYTNTLPCPFCQQADFMSNIATHDRDCIFVKAYRLANPDIDVDNLFAEEEARQAKVAERERQHREANERRYYAELKKKFEGN